MFESLIFGNLSALLVGVVSPLLVLAYLQRTPLRRKLVSSLMILKSIPKAPSLKRRIKLPWRFFLELLLLLLLVLAATMPYYRDRAQRVAILLDNSLSMRAVSGGKSKSRFEEAVEMLNGWLKLQSSRNSYSLFLVSPKLKRVGEERRAADQISALVGGVSAGYSPDSLGPSLAEIVSSGSFDKVLVVSDQERESAPVSTPGPVEVESILVGKLVGNIALSNLRIERRGLEQRSLIAAVTSSGMRSLTVRVKAFAEGRERPFSEVRSQISAGKVIEVPLELPPSLSSKTALRVAIETDEGDSIAEDNEGWISSEAQGATSVLVVSPAQAGGNAFGLSALEGITVDTVTPQSFSTMTLSAIGRYSLVIFHQTSVEVLPKIPALVILPPPSNNLFPVKREVSNPILSSFRAEHPITSYLRLELLSIPEAEVFDVPRWAQSVINLEQGAVVLAGESQGLRFSAVGMELLPFEGAKTPTASILLLNLFSWLSGGTEFTQSNLTGSGIRLEGDVQWQIIEPSGNSFVFERKDGADNFILEQPGVYRFKSSAGDKSLTVNAFHPEESATGARREFSAEMPATQAQESTDEDRPLWPYILQVVLGILTLDLIALAIWRGYSSKHADTEGALV